MKKVLTIILLFIAFLFIFYLQGNFFNNIATIAGIRPNLFIILVLFIGLFSNQILGVGLGIIFGLIIDLFYSRVVGPTAIMLCLVGYLGSYFNKNFSKENRITIMIMVIGATFLYEVGLYILNSAFLKFDIEVIPFLKIVLVEIIYNTLITILIYPLIKIAGYKMELNFKRNNILTRYF